MSRLRGRRTIARIPVHMAVIGFAVLWSVPTIALLVSSFRDPSAIAGSGWWEAFGSLRDFTIGNYEAVLGQRGMGRAFWNSVLITVPATLLVILVAALAAYALAWMNFP